MPHWICGVVMRSVRNENGSGGSSPGCISNRRPVDGRAVEPRRRAGLQAAEGEAGALEGPRKTHRRRLADPARRNLLLADMDQAAQKRAGGQHHGAAADDAAIGQSDARNALLDDQVVHLGFDHSQIGRLADRLLHRRRIELAVGLGARAAHGRAFAAVEHAKLDAAGIGDAAHQAVQRIDFAHQMALAEPADGRVAGHRADGGEAMGDQRRARAHARGCGRRLAAGMAAADDDHVEAGIHQTSPRPRPSNQRQIAGQKKTEGGALFHVKHAQPTHHVGVNNSFTNTEIAKDDVQNIFDINPASESAKCGRRGA